MSGKSLSLSILTIAASLVAVPSIAREPHAMDPARDEANREPSDLLAPRNR